MERSIRQNGDWFGNFWYWFNQRQKQVIFSLDPPHSLTLIDFQTFIRNAVIKPCLWHSHPTCQPVLPLPERWQRRKNCIISCR